MSRARDGGAWGDDSRQVHEVVRLTKNIELSMTAEKKNT